MPISAASQSPAQPIIPIPAFVFNHDVVGILNRIGRFITELIRSDSSNLNAMTAADKTRLASYFDDLDSYIAYVLANPVLDLPKTSHSVQWAIEPLDPVPSISNEDIEDEVRLLMLVHAELANSDSSSSGSGLISFDAVRVSAVVTKARNFLLNYIAKASPIDLPASSQMDAITPVAKPGT